LHRRGDPRLRGAGCCRLRATGKSHDHSKTGHGQQRTAQQEPSRHDLASSPDDPATDCATGPRTGTDHGLTHGHQLAPGGAVQPLERLILRRYRRQGAQRDQGGADTLTSEIGVLGSIGGLGSTECVNQRQIRSKQLAAQGDQQVDNRSAGERRHDREDDVEVEQRHEQGAEGQ
jgi:hypothetical protein